MKRFLIIPVLMGVLMSAASVSAATVPQTNLSFGARGEGVTELQNILIAANIGSSTAALKAVGATGYFGTLTRAALAEYQAKNGITPATGYYGPKTRAHLETNAGASVSLGVLEKVTTGCFVDGYCTVTVSGKEIILVAGLRPVDGQALTVGTLKGVDSIGDLEGKIGSVVKYYAAPATEGEYDFTLYGDANYYVEVLGAMPKAGTVTVSGTLGCLPPLDPNKATIALCALGLKGDDGLHYALSGEAATFSETGKRVRVTGEFSQTQEASAFERIGTITVSKITAL